MPSGRITGLESDQLCACATSSASEGPLAISFYAMTLEEDANESRAEHGEIVITTDPMLSLTEAAVLREALTQAFHGAVEDAEKAVATDDEAAASVLAVLRQNSAQAAGSYATGCG